MKIDIVSIGNSKGIRIPAAILKQLGLGKALELSVQGDHLVLKKPVRKKKHPRLSWTKDARRLAAGELSPEEREWLDFPNDVDDEWVW